MLPFARSRLSGRGSGCSSAIPKLAALPKTSHQSFGNGLWTSGRAAMLRCTALTGSAWSSSPFATQENSTTETSPAEAGWQIHQRDRVARMRCSNAWRHHPSVVMTHPGASTVPDTQDFDRLASDAIHDQVRRMQHDPVLVSGSMPGRPMCGVCGARPETSAPVCRRLGTVTKKKGLRGYRKPLNQMAPEVGLEPTTP